MCPLLVSAGCQGWVCLKAAYKKKTSESRQIQTANSKAQQTFPVPSLNDNNPNVDDIPDSQEKETINMRFHFEILSPVNLTSNQSFHKSA